MNRSQRLLEGFNLIFIQDLHRKQQRSETFLRSIEDELVNLMQDISILHRSVKPVSDNIVSAFDIELDQLVFRVSQEDRHPSSITREVHSAEDLEDLIIRSLRVLDARKASVKLHNRVETTLTHL